MAEKGPREYALRAIREGRVCVVHARSVPARDTVPFEVLGRVVGHSGVYSVGFRSGTWSCSCGLEQPCGHRTAVAQVVGHVVLPETEREVFHGRKAFQEWELHVDGAATPEDLAEVGREVENAFVIGVITEQDVKNLRDRIAARWQTEVSPSGSCAWCLTPGHHEDDCAERQAVSA